MKKYKIDWMILPHGMCYLLSVMGFVTVLGIMGQITVWGLHIPWGTISFITSLIESYGRACNLF